MTAKEKDEKQADSWVVKIEKAKAARADGKERRRRKPPLLATNVRVRIL
jgi:hypothetical protein